MAKGRKTGGRQKGSLNKKTVAAKAIMVSALASVEAAGRQMTPLEMLLAYMNNPATPQRMRIEAAKAAAPYCHPRLVATETVTNEKPRRSLARIAGLSSARAEKPFVGAKLARWRPLRPLAPLGLPELKPARRWLAAR